MSYLGTWTDVLVVKLIAGNYRRFHSLLKTYELLAEIVLFTIRVDIRCRVGHYLDLAVRYVSDAEPSGCGKY